MCELRITCLSSGMYAGLCYIMAYGYLEIAIEFGDRVQIWSFGSNLETRVLILESGIVFGNPNSEFRLLAYISRSGSNLEI